MTTSETMCASIGKLDFPNLFEVAAKSAPYRPVAVFGNFGPVFGTTYHHGEFEMFVGTATEAHRAGGREMGFQAMRDYARAKSVRIDVESQDPLFYRR